jgi:hypothetical protein
MSMTRTFMKYRPTYARPELHLCREETPRLSYLPGLCEKMAGTLRAS